MMHDGRMRVIIHIGLTKTGTSSLQQAFFQERALLSRHGIVYLVPTGSPQPTSAGLANTVIHDLPGLDETWAKLEPMTEGFQTALISSENFQIAKPENIAAFKDLLDRRLQAPDFIIYVGIRRWADRLVSLWQQDVRHGGFLSLPAYLERQLAAGPDGHPLDIARPIARWGQVFGAQSIMISRVDPGQDIVSTTFRDLLGITDSVAPHAANRSIIEQTEIIRAINLRHMDLHPRDRRTVIRSVLHFWNRSKRSVMAAAQLLAGRLQAVQISDDHPLFLELERRSGHHFPHGQPRSWFYVADSAFVRQDIHDLITMIDRKAGKRIARQKKTGSP